MLTESACRDLPFMNRDLAAKTVTRTLNFMIVAVGVGYLDGEEGRPDPEKVGGESRRTDDFLGTSS